MPPSTIPKEVTPLMSVIVPVYNEAETLPIVLQMLRDLAISKEILLVDDGSTDDSAAQIRHFSSFPEIQAFFHPLNMGKGAAIRTALHHARGNVILIQDSDLEYDPNDIEQLILPILSKNADVVFGSRLSSNPRQCKPIMRWANQWLTWMSNRFTGLALTDMETGYKALSREAARGLSLRENRFGIEPELTAKLARGGWRIIETPISYRPRDYAEGKKIGFKDGLRAVWCVIRYWRWD